MRLAYVVGRYDWYLVLAKKLATSKKRGMEYWYTLSSSHQVTSNKIGALRAS